MAQARASRRRSSARLPNADHAFTVSEESRCYGRLMPLLRTILLALLGLALPLGLALAVYLSSAGTISAAPVGLPPVAETIAKPTPRPKADDTKTKPKKQAQSGTTTSSGGTTTVDDHGGLRGSDDGGSSGSGSSGSGSDSSGSSGSSGSGSSGSGFGDD